MKRVPTHKCLSCGSLWKYYLPTDEEFGEAWSLCAGDACGACDNVTMGENLAPVEWMDLYQHSASFAKHKKKTKKEYHMEDKNENENEDVSTVCLCLVSIYLMLFAAFSVLLAVLYHAGVLSALAERLSL
jgi:hypothetical protein